MFLITGSVFCRNIISSTVSFLFNPRSHASIPAMSNLYLLLLFNMVVSGSAIFSNAEFSGKFAVPVVSDLFLFMSGFAWSEVSSLFSFSSWLSVSALFIFSFSIFNFNVHNIAVFLIFTSDF